MTLNPVVAKAEALDAIAAILTNAVSKVRDEASEGIEYAKSRDYKPERLQRIYDAAVDALNHAEGRRKKAQAEFTKAGGGSLGRYGVPPPDKSKYFKGRGAYQTAYHSAHGQTGITTYTCPSCGATARVVAGHEPYWCQNNCGEMVKGGKPQ